jgi:hypothetical protein
MLDMHGVRSAYSHMQTLFIDGMIRCMMGRKLRLNRYVDMLR